MTTCDGTRLLAVLAIAAAIAAPTPARAQAQDQATARALFEQGRKLMKDGHFADACPKFEAAAKAYPSAGIFLNLGACYEKTGRTASAWTEFGEAASVAARSNRTADAEEARRRQQAIEPLLTKIVLHVGHPVPGLTLERDGEPVGNGAWGAPIPVDPGSHELRAEADGFQPWSATQDIEGKGQTTVVEVPELQPLAVAGPPSPPSVPAAAPAPLEAVRADAVPAERAHRSRAVPLTLLVAGAAVGLAGGATWVVGWRESVSAHDEGSGPKGNSDWKSASTVYWAGVAVTGVGAIAAAVGVVLLATSGSPPPSTGLTVSPWVAWNSGGLSLGRAW